MTCTFNLDPVISVGPKSPRVSMEVARSNINGSDPIAKSIITKMHKNIAIENTTLQDIARICPQFYKSFLSCL
jgi:hypothetical protein